MGFRKEQNNMYTIDYWSTPGRYIFEGYCVKNEEGEKIGGCFDDELQAFDYIKTQLEPDERYKQYTGFPEMFIMEIYRTLGSDGKRRVLKELVRGYKEKCAYEYFKR